ncbi:amino acid ABC transporter substrate-binding protein [Oceaniradius stylonematis]|uniref:amino acid ABC transporter substrate-binding protein n=1 Tax=Oceaniradius stylonematis TaxID=2184161 RepID=UPI00273EEF90|nr:amino acid ABC transporter substrate-binding protein [Oceaniradius stylonematis]
MKWTSLAGAAGLIAAFSLSVTAYAQDDRSVIRIGYAVSKTGPNAGGTAASTTPNYELWVKEVNDRGGIMLESLGKRVPVEVVEYDDRSNSEEAVRAVERLIVQDEVDLVLPPWGTSMNLAVAPILNQHGYPHLAVAAVTDRAYELSERWPNLFFYEGTSSEIATNALKVFATMRDAGTIGSKVAMIGISDSFGIELATAARKAAAEYNIDIVYDRSYPAGTQDFTLILGEIKALEPDVFLAFSYPPDTLTLTEQSRIQGFNPSVYFTSIGTAFPLFLERFGENAEGVMGVGGVDGDSELIQAYIARHKEFAGFEPDRFTSPLTYASLEILEQAIERVGDIDHEAIIAEMQSGSFETILGEVRFEGNMLQNVFQIGQWQGGEFHGIAPSDLPGARQPVAPKAPWTN